MERGVFWVAIIVAIFVALGATFGGGVMHFSGSAFGMDPVVEATPGQSGPQAYQASEIDIEHAAVRLVVTAEDRPDYLIEIANPGRVPTPEIRLENGRVLITGRLKNRISDCHEGGGADIAGYGVLTLEELPVVTIRAPRTLSLDVSSAGLTEVGAAEAVNLSLSGCAAARIADVTGALDLDVAGSGSVDAASAGALDLDLAGSGRVGVGAVAGGADVDLAGSAQANIASVGGALDADLGGSGAIVVAGGQISTLDVDVAGSGRFELTGGAVNDADVDIAGSGQIRLAAPMQRLTVSTAGSGDVAVDAPVGDIDVELAGSASVRVQSVSGSVRQQVYGSGQLQIGE